MIWVANLKWSPVWDSPAQCEPFSLIRSAWPLTLLFHWCAFGAQSSSVPSMSHSVTKNKKGENELQEFLHFITLPGYLSGSSVPVLFLTSAYSPFYIYLFIEISSEEDSTVHLGDLFQCLIILFGNMIVVVYCCKCCCKKLVTFCLTRVAVQKNLFPLYANASCPGGEPSHMNSLTLVLPSLD